MEVQFGERFEQEKFKIQKLESALLSGELYFSLDQYTKLNRAYLSVQLPFFCNKYACSSKNKSYRGRCPHPSEPDCLKWMLRYSLGRRLKASMLKVSLLRASQLEASWLKVRGGQKKSLA